MRILALFAAIMFSASAARSSETVVGMNQQVFSALEGIQATLDAEQFSAAESALQKLLDRNLSSYEKAQTLNMLGQLYWRTEQWEAAETIFHDALEQDRLPSSLIANLTATTARLALVQHDYLEAEKRFLALLDLPDQDTAEHRMLLANVYVGMQHWDQALEYARSGLAKQNASGREPLESWLSLLVSIYYSLEDYSAMQAVLKEMVSRWPRQRHLMNLAAISGEMGDTEYQLGLIEAIVNHDLVVREQDLLILAGLFMSEGLPYKAAKLLQGAMDVDQIAVNAANLRRLSQAWFLAGRHDKAIPPLEQAAALTADASLYLTVARFYLAEYQHAAADKAAATALHLDTLDEPGTAWLLRGMAATYLEAFDDAQSYFEAALPYEASTANARQWLNYIQHERARLAVDAADASLP